MTPDEVLKKPRFLRTFLLKSMEIQLDDEAEQAKAARQRQDQMIQAAARRRKK